MRILVTGGCGFVGTVLTERLLADGHEVVVVDTQWFGNHLRPADSLTVVQMDIRDARSIPLDGVEAVGSNLLTWRFALAFATFSLVARAVSTG